MSDYDNVVAGSLRLRNGQGVHKKKKKHRRKIAVELNEEDRTVEDPTTSTTIDTEAGDKPTEKPTQIDRSHLTKAQREWERRKDKKTLQTILSEADKSHKQRIIEFNNHLETLTEHFDIQKVSWTK